MDMEVRMDDAMQLRTQLNEVWSDQGVQSHVHGSSNEGDP